MKVFCNLLFLADLARLVSRQAEPRAQWLLHKHYVRYLIPCVRIAPQLVAAFATLRTIVDSKRSTDEMVSECGGQRNTKWKDSYAPILVHHADH